MYSRRETEVFAELTNHVVALRRRDPVALVERVQIFTGREPFDTRDERREVGGPVRDLVVIPRGGRFGRQIEHVGPIPAADRLAAGEIESEVQDRGLKHHTVECDALPNQIVRQRGRTRRAVTLAEEKFRRIPAIEFRKVIRDELPERRDVLIDAEERLLLARHDPAEAGVRHVDEDEIALVEQAVRIVLDAVRRRPAGLAVGGEHAHRTNRSHAQPHRRAARTAVIDERDRTRRRVRTVFGVGRVENRRRRFTVHVVERDQPGAGRVCDRLAVECDRMGRYRIRKHSVLGGLPLMLRGRGLVVRCVSGARGYGETGEHREHHER